MDLFHTSSPEDFDNFLEEVPTSITDYKNRKLMAEATEEEVKAALFMMHTEKAPGPDEMTGLFYQQS